MLTATFAPFLSTFVLGASVAVAITISCPFVTEACEIARGHARGKQEASPRVAFSEMPWFFSGISRRLAGGRLAQLIGQF
jgi:hypothetical protein